MDKKIFDILSDYDKALSLLDDYDHQCLKTQNGVESFEKLSYEECREIIDNMNFDSSLFGVEKDDSFKSSINAIYQSAFGKDVYQTVEEKAAHLLYFITKNHSFVDGNKRIAASIFLLFLMKNNMLYDNKNNKILSDSALVALVILIAQSKAEEKDIMIKLIMNFLKI